MPKGLKTSELPEQRHLFFRLRVADNQKKFKDHHQDAKK